MLIQPQAYPTVVVAKAVVARAAAVADSAAAAAVAVSSKPLLSHNQRNSKAALFLERLFLFCDLNASCKSTKTRGNENAIRPAELGQAYLRRFSSAGRSEYQAHFEIRFPWLRIRSHAHPRSVEAA